MGVTSAFLNVPQSSRKQDLPLRPLTNFLALAEVNANGKDDSSTRKNSTYNSGCLLPISLLVRVRNTCHPRSSHSQIKFHQCVRRAPSTTPYQIPLARHFRGPRPSPVIKGALLAPTPSSDHYHDRPPPKPAFPAPNSSYVDNAGHAVTKLFDINVSGLKRISPRYGGFYYLYISMSSSPAISKHESVPVPLPPSSSHSRTATMT